MLQEGTIAVVGTVDQVKFDFAELAKALAASQKLTGRGFNIQPKSFWQLWEAAMVEVMENGKFSDSTVDAFVDITDCSKLVSDTVEFVAGINRPMLMKRVKDYAEPILTEKEFRTCIVVPQIRFDFAYLIENVDMDVVSMLERYRDMVIAGEVLEDGEALDEDLVLLCFGLATSRPFLRERINGYLDVINVVSKKPEPHIETPASNGDSGLPASLLDPPSPAV